MSPVDPNPPKPPPPPDKIESGVDYDKEYRKYLVELLKWVSKKLEEHL